MTSSRRDFLTTTSLSLAALATGCAHGLGVQLPPWQVSTSFGREQRHAIEAVLLDEDDDDSAEAHKKEIEDHLVSIYSQHPQRESFYAAAGLHLTDGIVLTVDHAVRDTFLAAPDRRHFIEHGRRQRQIVSVLARHPGYDLALLGIEDDHLLDCIHLHMRNPSKDMGADVMTYQSGRHWMERTRVLSNSDIAFMANGGQHTDMFRIHHHFHYGWSGAAVVSRSRGHLIGLVSSSPQRQNHGYSSCSRTVRINDI